METVKVQKRTQKTDEKIQAVPAVAVADGGRVYSTQLEFDHDLFKLNLSKFKKNIAIQDHEPNYVDTEHVHWYHTIDSDGKKQLYSTPVGGHFHVLEIIPSATPGHPPTVKCASGPVKFAKRKNKYGKFEKVLVPLNDVDDHRHDITYIRSDKIKARATNAEALKVQSMDALRGQPIPGVQG